jgi:uncharacterized membrane protein YccC
MHPVTPAHRWQRAWRTFVSLHSESNLNAFAWTEGLRAAIGISTPVAIGLLTGHLAWGILAGFAVLWILSCDLGGAYRQKAMTLAGSAVTIVVAYFFAIWMTWSATNYVVGTFIWVFLAALIGVAGSAAAQAGLVSSTIVITSVALIAPGEYWTRFIACLIGMGWALLLCLALWPLRAYSPLFQALAMSCAKLANLADAFWLGAATVERPATNFQFATAYDGLMTSLERCRNIWGALRARRAGPTTRSMQLLLLIEQLDDLGRTLVAFREMVNLVGREPWFAEFRPHLESLTHALSELGREISEAIAVRGKPVDASGVQNLFRKLEARLNPKADQGSPGLFQRKELARTIKHLVEQFIVLAEIASELRSGQPAHREPPEARFGPRPRTFNPIAEIRNSLSFRSSSFRHALRLSAATTLGALLASVVHIARGYWIPMTVVLVLKPNFGGTLQRSVQRITGTVLGALLAALLISFCRDLWLLVLGVALLAGITFTLRNRNYGLFAMALTPLVMLMLDLAHPGTVTDSFLRIFHTMIGSLLALLCGYLVFPDLEVSRFPTLIAAAFRAEAAFLRAFGDLVRGKEKRPMSEFRQNAAVAVSNAATAAERLLAEPPRLRGDVEEALTAVNYCRQILHALAAISDYPAREPIRLQSGYAAELLLRLVQTLADALEGFAVSLETGTDPRRLRELSELTDELEELVGTAAQQAQPDTASAVGRKLKTNDTVAWLFYHLHHISDLTLGGREVVHRLLRSEAKRRRTSPFTAGPRPVTPARRVTVREGRTSKPV